MVTGYFTSNFMMLMILASIITVMYVNRKTMIPASEPLAAVIILLTVISVTDFLTEYMSDLLIEGSAEDLPFSLSVCRFIHYAAAIITYILRPAVIMTELFFIVPDVKYKKLIILPEIINALIYAAAPLVKDKPFFVFYYDERDKFQRAPLGNTVFYAQFIYLFLLIYCSEKYFREKNRDKLKIISVIIGMALITALLESKNILPGYSDQITALSILLYYMYLVSINQQELADTAAKNELRAARDQIMILRNQIQPHFILNSLAVIRSLAKTDKRRAVEAIDSFSDYLRINMQAIRSDTLITFENELENVGAYISLAKMDYTKNIEVNYDLKEYDFRLPPLILEPIVENAVKYGIGRDGGSISVSTFRNDGNIIIRVEDSGAGKSYVTDKESKRLGIGIENTRRRLDLLCGGKLEINITENGTTADIIIPV